MSQDWNVVQIETPTNAQIDAIVAVCVRAYDQDIATKVFTGGDMSLSEDMWRSMVRAGFHSGAVYVASGSPDFTEILSVGVWFGPGQVLYATEEQRALGFTEFFAKVAPEYQKWITQDFSPKVREFKIKVLGPTLERDSWYGNLMATDPKHQKKGLASAILKTICKRAKNEGKMVVLGTQTEENATFYRNFGFHEVGKMDEKTPWGIFTGNMFTLDPTQI
ncbi:hypothetical protein K435DRAFT_769655 [Dendrothele bispora CBS 962.96]|uniref:N-acetyltransferase domain-containing protein n=1 Tax=Dendrothele bispora (strain CBS 962.96) TaxID=1314807 RepID=A0A4S8KR48_DENBC|nr:hypothetical protein K435DRAFT_769655 [Dendrothele bispora CBS 962.96]